MLAGACAWTQNRRARAALIRTRHQACEARAVGTHPRGRSRRGLSSSSCGGGGMGHGASARQRPSVCVELLACLEHLRSHNQRRSREDPRFAELSLRQNALAAERAADFQQMTPSAATVRVIGRDDAVNRAPATSQPPPRRAHRSWWSRPLICGRGSELPHSALRSVTRR